jgi:neutral ceramidase
MSRVETSDRSMRRMCPRKAGMANRMSQHAVHRAGWVIGILIGAWIRPDLVRAQQCTRGFLDPRNGGECWECPSGFNRTIAPVDAANACETVRPAIFSAASRRSREGCEPDDIFDPRNGGECWRCPSGLVRTWSPVNSAEACGQPGGVFDKKQRATFTKRVGCNAGDFPDIGWCWRCLNGSVRGTAHIESSQACVIPARTESRSATFIEPLPLEACGSEGQPGCPIGSRRRAVLQGLPCETRFAEINARCVKCGGEGQPGCPILSPPRRALGDLPCDRSLAEINSRCVKCGGENQPGCPVASPPRKALGDLPCDSSLAEINARCVKCGSENQPGCPAASPPRAALGDLACETHLAELDARCVKCGDAGQRGCPVASLRRKALGDQPCEPSYEEVGGRCQKRPDTPCGDIGQRACCVGEQSFGTCAVGRSTEAGCPYGAEQCRCGKGSIFQAVDHCVAECSAGARWDVAPNVGCDTYRIGLATRDITGPVVDSQMQGYANGVQISQGLHMRLWARAFVVEGCNRQRVAFVSAELAQMFHSVREGVVEQLQKKFGKKYSYDNVLVSATHTHAAIQGYTHYVWMNLAGMQDTSDHQGFDRDNFDAIVNGITEAIVDADKEADHTKGTIRIGAGTVDSRLSFNRSIAAYNLNSAAERAGLPEVDRTMTLLRFDSSDGRELGSFNWLPVHNTTYSKENLYVSGDAKGMAAYWLEQEKGVVEWGARGGYVAGFAQAHCGDVSPNLPVQARDPNPPTSASDANHSRTIPNALAQLAAANSIIATAAERVHGSVEVINSFVDFENVVVDRAYSRNALPTKTCEAWYGAVFEGGSKEDGENAQSIREGAQITGVGFGGMLIPFVGLPAAINRLCHQKELHPIVVLGKRADVHWSPTMLPLQIVVMGQLAIAAVPFEMTTMSGRRLQKSLLEALGPRVKHVVIAGLANDYAGYVTTREEHAAVHYEGASTQFGPDTESAVRQEFTALSCALKSRSAALAAPWRNVTPPDLRAGNIVGPSNPASRVFATGSRLQPVKSRIQPDYFDAGRPLAAIVQQVKPSYSPGETVVFQYRGGHPRRSIRRLPSFFRIERRDDTAPSGWRLVASDTSPETRFVWLPTEIMKPSLAHGPQYHSELRIEWTLSMPNSGRAAKPGTYRLRFFGHTDTGNGLTPYEGTSNELVVTN